MPTPGITDAKNPGIPGSADTHRPSVQQWTLAASVLGSSMAFIDGTVVNVALPALQDHLNGTVSQVQWVVESYALLLAALLLVGGAAGDRYGRRLVYVAGVLVFGVASVLCGLSQNIHQLIAMRALQGAGAALLVPNSLALLSNAYGAADRGRAIGSWSGLTAITTALGPVLGGWLVQNVSWRAIFYLNVPLAAATVLICVFCVRESRLPRDKCARLDWVGAVLVTVGLALLTVAMVEWRARSITLSVAAVLGVAALLAFVVNEKKTRDPMMPLELFQEKSFSAANLLTLLLYAGLSGFMFFLPLLLIQIRGYTPTEAGAALLPFVVLMFGLSRWSGGLVDRYGPRLPLTFGPLIAGVGFVMFGLLTGGNYWTSVLPSVIVLGFGMTICVPTLTTTVMSSAGEERAGIASGVNNAVSRVAGLFGVALFGLVLSTVFAATLGPRMNAAGVPSAVQQAVQSQRDRIAAIRVSDPEAVAAIRGSFMVGYRTVLFAAAGLAWLSAAVAATMLRAKVIPEE